MFLTAVAFSSALPFLMHTFLVRACGLFKQAFVRQRGAIAAFLLGFVPLGVVLYCSATLWSRIYLFLIYIISCYIYFHIFNMSETARRIRILIEIQKTGIFDKEQLTDKYPVQDIIANRLQRLLALGELRLLADKYVIGRGAFILPAKAIFYLRNILHLL